MLDLFSGIGGFSLAASWVWGDELDIVGFCEIDEFCHKVLNKNFPGVPIYKDITRLDTKNFKDIDLITGGFPCQDISIAGKGKGLIDEETGERTRSGLWSEMHRIISDIRPRFAVIENVPMLTIRGGTRVIEDLAQIGYDAEWQIVGADQVGAWHRRKRIWIVANSRCEYGERQKKLSKYEIEDRSKDAPESNRSTKCNKPGPSGRTENVPDSDNTRSRASKNGINKDRAKKNKRWRKLSQPQLSRHSKNVPDFDSIRGCSWETNWEDAENVGEASRCKRSRNRNIKSQMGNLANGLPSRMARCWEREPNIPRVANNQKDRINKLKALGNSIVPEVAYQILKRIAH